VYSHDFRTVLKEANAFGSLVVTYMCGDAPSHSEIASGGSRYAEVPVVKTTEDTVPNLRYTIT